MVVIYDISYVDAMEGHEFEHFIANLLRKLGYQKVGVTPGSGDQGVDVLAEKDEVRYAIQCKCYSSDLGNTSVQEVNTGKIIYHCHVGVVVTNRYFTQGAQEAAKATGVLLWDRSKLESMIAQVQAIPDEEVATQQRENIFTPWTGSPLLRRGGFALEDGDWKKANQFFERVLNTDPENAEAYVGKTLLALQLSSIDELNNILINLDSFKDFKRAMRFATGDLQRELQAIYNNAQRRLLVKRLCEIISTYRKKVEEKNLELQRQAAFQEYIEKLPEVRRKHTLAAHLLAVEDGLIAGVCSDGIVEVMSVNGLDESDVWRYSDITAVAVGGCLMVGLMSDGTVVVAGSNEAGQCDVLDWMEIIAVAAGYAYTVGLRTDGTVVAIGDNKFGQCNVSDWRDITSVTSGNFHTVGLRKDGTVVAVGSNEAGECDVSDWKEIIAVAAGKFHTVGLRTDGTVVAVGHNWSGQCNVLNWTNIIAVAAGERHTVALCADRTVVAVGNNSCHQCAVSDWKNIVAIAAGGHQTVGLQADGTVVVTEDKSNRYNQRDVQDWKLFNSFDTLEQEQAEAIALWEAERKQKEAEIEAERLRQEIEERQRKAAEEAEIERKRLEEIVHKKATLEAEQGELQAELTNLKGWFTRRRRREIEARLTEITSALKNLREG